MIRPYWRYHTNCSRLLFGRDLSILMFEDKNILSLRSYENYEITTDCRVNAELYNI